jgi:hypothetical protein
MAASSDSENDELTAKERVSSTSRILACEKDSDLVNHQQSR